MTFRTVCLTRLTSKRGSRTNGRIRNSGIVSLDMRDGGWCARQLKCTDLEANGRDSFADCERQGQGLRTPVSWTIGERFRALRSVGRVSVRRQDTLHEVVFCLEVIS